MPSTLYTKSQKDTIAHCNKTANVECKLSPKDQKPQNAEF